MQVSVLEAWQHAAQTVEASYKEQGRLATEHAALDDLGDGKASGPGLGRRAAGAKRNHTRSRVHPAT